MRILDINDIENVKLSETICVLYSHHAVSAGAARTTVTFSRLVSPNTSRVYDRLAYQPLGINIVN